MYKGCNNIDCLKMTKKKNTNTRKKKPFRCSNFPDISIRDVSVESKKSTYIMNRTYLHVAQTQTQLTHKCLLRYAITLT